MYQLHDNKTAAHLGEKKTISKVSQRFYWPGIKVFIKWWVSTCLVCQRFKNPNRKARGVLQQYRVGVKFERIAMDLIGPLPETDTGHVYILVICDYFTKFVEAVALPNKRTETVTFVVNWVCKFGCPRELHSDQGAEFESAVFRKMCELLDSYCTP